MRNASSFRGDIGDPVMKGNKLKTNCPKCGASKDTPPGYRWVDCRACGIRFEVRNGKPTGEIRDANNQKKGGGRDEP